MTDTSRSGDLVERLRDPMPPHHGKCLKAADRIETLEAEVEGLRDLLVRGYVVCDGDDEDAVAFRNDVRAALGEKQ